MAVTTRRRVPPSSPYYYTGNQAPTGIPSQPNYGSREGPIKLGQIGRAAPGSRPIGPAADTTIPVGSLTIPGSSPDYLSNFSTDPEYTAAVGELAGQSQADRTQMLNAIKAMAVQWGGDLSGLLKSGLVDQAAVNQAKANTFSTTAELGRDLGRAQAGLTNQLAARGVLRGGGLTVGNNMLQENFQRETQRSQNELNQNVNSAQQQFLQGEAQRGAELRSVRAGVYARLAQMQAMASVPDQVYQPSQATWDYSLGGYLTSDGRVYGAGGNLIGMAGQPGAFGGYGYASGGSNLAHGWTPSGRSTGKGFEGAWSGWG